MQDTKRCPYCGEEILAVAKKCKHCGEWLDRGAKPNVVESTPPKSENATIEKDAIRTDSASSGTTNKTEAKKSRTLYYIIGE